MSHYESKHGIVSKSQAELYMGFTDLRNFTQMLPPEYRDAVKADFDNLSASVQGFNIAVTVSERRPYDLIRIISTSSPVEFSVSLHFNPDGNPYKTDFSIELDANLNLMMKALIGGRIREALDKVVDALVAVSEGRMPDGMPAGFNPGDFR